MHDKVITAKSALYAANNSGPRTTPETLQELIIADAAGLDHRSLGQLELAEYLDWLNAMQEQSIPWTFAAIRDGGKVRLLRCACPHDLAEGEWHNLACTGDCPQFCEFSVPTVETYRQANGKTANVIEIAVGESIADWSWQDYNTMQQALLAYRQAPLSRREPSAPLTPTA